MKTMPTPTTRKRATKEARNGTVGPRWPAIALNPVHTPESAFANRELRRHAYYSDDRTLIFCADAGDAIGWLARAGVKVDTTVTSPPFYGQRDYRVDGQIGLELHPSEYLARLVSLFQGCREIFKETSSLWVNLGDTYWSGRGEHRSGEAKQSARRFGLRPQDRKGDGVWCRPKQLLLIPHRFAIAMQESEWILRNDNVWVKPNPVPDQVRDRCSMGHEYMFHFVTQRFYYFRRDRVGRPNPGKPPLPPLDVWVVPPSKGSKGHPAAFSSELVDLPIRATTPPDGVVLDPFAGSGTTLLHARRLGFRAIAVDIKREYCAAMADACKAAPAAQS